MEQGGEQAGNPLLWGPSTCLRARTCPAPLQRCIWPCHTAVQARGQSGGEPARSGKNADGSSTPPATLTHRLPTFAITCLLDSPSPLACQFEDDWQLDSHAAMGRRLLRLESDNARQGLPPGQAIEAAAAPSGSGSAGNLAGVSGATSGLLGTLRGAAAAAAAEEAEERRQSRGGWLARLLPGRGSEDGGSGEAAEGLRASVEAARSRLSRLVAPSAAADSYWAGYADLPASPGTSPPTSRGMSAASRPPRPSGPGGSGADLLSGSPGVRLSGGGLKAARAAYLARGSGGALAGGGGVAGVRRGSVDVESPGSASS